MGIEDLNFGNMFDTIKQVLKDTVLFPFRLWHQVPEKVRLIIFLVAAAIGVLILIAAILLRNKWKERYVN